jgi:hypothetical protein
MGTPHNGPAFGSPRRTTGATVAEHDIPCGAVEFASAPVARTGQAMKKTEPLAVPYTWNSSDAFDLKVDP